MDGFTGNAADFAQAHQKVNGVKSAMDANLASLRGAIEACKKAGSEIEAQFDQLTSDLQPLAQSWTGAAQAAYQQTQDEWNKALDEMKALLARIATALPQINEAYQGTDKGISNMFGG